MDIEKAISVIQHGWPVAEHVVREVVTLFTVIGKIDPESIANRWGGDSHKVKKAMREIRLFLDMKKQVEETGVSFKAIRWETLFPLLDAAVLNDETEPGGEQMFKRWASLLANASIDPGGVPPSFPEILRQLSAQDAKFFDQLYKLSRMPLKSEDTLGREFSRAGLTTHPWGSVFSELEKPSQRAAEIMADHNRLSVAVGQLMRLGLLEKIPDLASWEQIRPHDGVRPISQEIDFNYRVTDLGYAFHKACQPPMKP